MINVGEVGMVSITDIDIGERARQEMGDLESLEANMKQSGLITPLAVMKQEPPKMPYFLLAGERRLGVLIKNGTPTVPVRIYPAGITEIEIRSIELAENFHRKDFEWNEHDALIRSIHELQQEIHGEKISTLADAPGWGMKETGDLVGKEKGTVSSAIKRANAVEAFPELFEKCKTQSDASKVLKRLDEEIIKDVLVQKIAAQKIDVDKEALMNSYVLKDFFEFVKECPDEYFHLVEIDPPYAIDLPKAKKDYIYGDTYNEVDKDKYQEFLANTLAACYKKMAEHSWLIFWFAPEPWFETVFQHILAAGF
jgi:ParB-like chromosome segregation protein Spo0J